MRRLAGLLLLVALAACSPRPEPAEPALWEIEGTKGEAAWLFGTIHTLPRPAAWRSAAIDDALTQSDRIVVEVADIANDAAMAEVFADLARTPDLPPLSQRVSPRLRKTLAALLDKGGMKENQFATTETWAAALMLARIGDRSEGAYGIDRAVIEAAGTKPVVELEGAARQLGIFDTLPEQEQRDLLAAVLSDTKNVEAEQARLAATWRQGDMTAIEAETRTGILADPELRQVLFTVRNRDWTAQVIAMLQRGERPFVAVGAAHMAGPEGLPAMLAARGYRVTRVQ